MTIDELETEVRKHHAEISETLRALRAWRIANKIDETDVRLQLHNDGTISIHYGDAQYDTDHSGYWGASTLSQSDSTADLEYMARDLVNQAIDSAAEDMA